MAYFNPHKKYCPYHAKNFEKFKIGEFTIEVCPVCTTPNKKNKGYRFRSLQSKKTNKNAQHDKHKEYRIFNKDVPVFFKHKKSTTLRIGLNANKSFDRTE